MVRQYAGLWIIGAPHFKTLGEGPSVFLGKISYFHTAFSLQVASQAGMHLASLLRTIFVSLAHDHGRVHVHNVRDFLQTKLDGKITARFLLKHGDRYFLLHNFGLKTIRLKLKN